MIWGGIGAFTKVFLNNGIEAVCVDGPRVNKKNLYINEKYFVERDFEEYNEFGKKYDLALSLEVAEHLSPKAAKNFVKTLCHCSDFVIFSAAIPNQGGQNHINEQLPQYRRALFGAEGFKMLDCFRNIFRENKKIPGCYKQNMFLYYKNTEEPPKTLHEETPLYIVHPDILEFFSSPYRCFKNGIYLIFKKWGLIKNR